MQSFILFFLSLLCHCPVNASFYYYSYSINKYVIKWWCLVLWTILFVFRKLSWGVFHVLIYILHGHFMFCSIFLLALICLVTKLMHWLLYWPVAKANLTCYDYPFPFIFLVFFYFYVTMHFQSLCFTIGAHLMYYYVLVTFKLMLLSYFRQLP